jgi:nucleoredoxin
MDLLNKTEIVKKDGSSTQGLGSAPKIVLVYFSAHWCPPCRGFTPVLAEFYKACKAAGNDLECIFVSSDQDEAGWKSYWESMPWVSVKFGHENVPALKQHFGVSGIPKLVALNGATGAVISDNGRGDVTSSGPGAYAAWVAKC